MRKTIVTLTDDLDGTDAAETVTFALDGRTFEIDLSAEHAADLRAAFEPWVASARRAHSRGTARRSSTRRDREQTKAIRSWAVAAGLLQRDSRGRIPAAVAEAYDAAH